VMFACVCNGLEPVYLDPNMFGCGVGVAKAFDMAFA
jgi:hypothetical protein